MMNRFKKSLCLRFPAVCLVALSLAGGLAGCQRPAPETESVEAEPTPDYYKMIRSVDKLILSEMTINKLATVEDLKLDEAKGGRQTLDAVLNMFKIGTRKGAYSYNTYLQAYIDLSDLRPSDVKVDTVTKIMTISLPEIQTEFAGRDVEVREDHYRVTGLRSNIGPEERAAVKEAMNEALKKEVEERAGFRQQLRRSAREKAESYFQEFAKLNGYSAEITFRDKSSTSGDPASTDLIQIKP